MPTALAALLPSCKLALRADRKSPQTIDSYTTGVRLFLAWCAEQGHAVTIDIDRHLVARLGEPTCWPPVQRPQPQGGAETVQRLAGPGGWALWIVVCAGGICFSTATASQSWPLRSTAISKVLRSSSPNRVFSPNY